MRNTLLIAILLYGSTLYAQFVFPDKIERNHPRLLSPDVNKEQILKEIETSEEVSKSYAKFKDKIASYVKQHETDPEWIVSRLQMYWKSHATDVFVDGIYYSHSEGRAPVPTVRFNGERDYITDYKVPSTEDIRPYMEDERGLWLQHKETGKWQWVELTETARVIAKINHRIMTYAQDAALVYYLEGDEAYAKFAADIFDTYMHGIYYRNRPFDLKTGATQTLGGYTAFQAIKEPSLRPMSVCYDYLYDYLKANAAEQMPIYATSLKKMAEIIVNNGVPDNNWNLIQADYIIQLAFVLEDDSFYEDGKGCQHYLDRVFNKTEARQWSMTKLLNTGYDQNNGIWEECAGYSIMVTEDFTKLMGTMQDAVDTDILPYMPVIPQAVRILPQYLFPNKYVIAFGDTHYGKIGAESMKDMVKNAQKFDKPEQEREFTAMAHMMNDINGNETHKKEKSKNAFAALLAGHEVVLDENIPAGDINDYITSTFYAPNISWLAMRNGFDAKHGLMISQVGALGNHMHSNGIAMELYGKNYVLGVEGGRGASYHSADYLEYYSQFPAHNTVAVNGISQYKEMRSYHPFEVNSVYPESERKSGYYPEISFSDLYFLEPKTNADQNRVMSIVRTGETSGYYIDIFRSKCKDGDDKYHDYFYHNLGQELIMTNSKGEELVMQPSERLSSKGGDLVAYDYFLEKQSVFSTEDFNAKFELSIPGEEKVSMNMWMSGNDNREIFKVKAPRSEALRAAMVPKDIADAPLYTTVVRNTGEAWSNPFIAVYEPSCDSEPSTIKNITQFEAEGASDAFVGLKIESISERTDYIFSSDTALSFSHQGISINGTFGVVTIDTDTTTLFLGAGNQIKNDNYSLLIKGDASSATLKYSADGLFLTADAPVVLTVPDTFKRGNILFKYGENQIKGVRFKDKSFKGIRFNIPAISYQKIMLKKE